MYCFWNGFAKDVERNLFVRKCIFRSTVKWDLFIVQSLRWNSSVLLFLPFSSSYHTLILLHYWWNFFEDHNFLQVSTLAFFVHLYNTVNFLVLLSFIQDGYQNTSLILWVEVVQFVKNKNNVVDTPNDWWI